MYADGAANGWRHTYVVLGCIAAAFAPVGWAFYRDTPETYGLLPDGRKPHEVQLAQQPKAGGSTSNQSAKAVVNGTQGEVKGAESAAIEVNWTLKEARATIVFWTTSFSIMLLSLTGTACKFGGE
eukprot:SAG31_NODE_2356_length_5874_cov_17.280000_5_plen_125_part_00